MAPFFTLGFLKERGWRRSDLYPTAASHRCRLLPEPLGIPLILAVQIHLLGPQGHAAVAVEVKTVVSADVGPLLLQLAVFRFKEFRKTRFGPFGPFLDMRKEKKTEFCVLSVCAGLGGTASKNPPADQDVGHRRPLDRAVAAEGEAGLAVDVLRVAHVRAVVALVDGHVYSSSFRVRLQDKSHPNG